MLKNILKKAVVLTLSVSMALANAYIATAAPSITYNGNYEAIVGNDSGLYAALRNQSVRLIRLADDIQINRKDLEIHQSRLYSDLTIDGEGHALTDFPQKTLSTGTPIRLVKSGGNVKTITLTDVNVVGQNGYGTLYVASNVRNVDVVIDNVTYEGPKLVTNTRGTVTLQDSDINITTASGSYFAAEVATAKDIFLDGDINIHKADDIDGDANGVFATTLAKSVVATRPGSNVTITNDSLTYSQLSGYVTADVRHDIDFGANSTFSYTGYRAFYNHKNPEYFEVGRGADVRINLSESADRKFASNPLIMTDASFRVNDGASFNFVTDGNLRYSALSAKRLFYAGPQSDFRVVSLNNNSSTVRPLVTTINNADFEVDSPANFLVATSARATNKLARALGTDGTSRAKIHIKGVSEIGLWGTDGIVGPDADGKYDLAAGRATRSWSSASGAISIEGTVSTGDTHGEFVTLSSSGADSELTKANFAFIGVKGVRIGGTFLPPTINYVVYSNGEYIDHTMTLPAGQSEFMAYSLQEILALEPNFKPRADYEFTGWGTEYDQSHPNYRNYKPGDKVDVNDLNADYTLYAEWDLDVTYYTTVEFRDSNGNTTLTLQAPRRDLYILPDGANVGIAGVKEWKYTDSLGKETRHQIGDGFSFDEQPPYTYVFTADGGTPQQTDATITLYNALTSQTYDIKGYIGDKVIFENYDVYNFQPHTILPFAGYQKGDDDSPTPGEQIYKPGDEITITDRMAVYWLIWS
ncbi:MAG: hypothetical protein LBL35_00835 [Clostridiales bacterium]|jgi:hypothetical protein|nr:hypothetical protein [Clostridiales bacterium]